MRRDGSTRVPFAGKHKLVPFEGIDLKETLEQLRSSEPAVRLEET